MSLIELNRYFVELSNEEATDFEIGALWGAKRAGWLDWNDLLDVHRVVLLAEAASGKSSEFEFRAASLNASGSYALRVTIEALADKTLSACVPPDHAKPFGAWKKSTRPGYFFLDSVDEALLKHKTLESALLSFIHGIGSPNLHRAHIYISCRVSDWRGAADREVIERLLHIPKLHTVVLPLDDDDRLLAPIFDRKKEKPPWPGWREKKPIDPLRLLIVQLTPLSAQQAEMLAVIR